MLFPWGHMAPSEPSVWWCGQVNDEVKRYNGVLKKFADAGDDEWEAIVTVHRGDLQKPFFEHLQVWMATLVFPIQLRRSQPCNCVRCSVWW